MEAKRKFSSYTLVMAIGIAFMFLFGYIVPPFNVVTETGVKMLGVLLGLIIITCFNGDMLSGSLLALLATVFHGYYTGSELLATWLGSTSTVQLVFCGALCLALRESGAMNVLAKKLLANRLCRGRPVMTMVMLFLATYVVGAFVSGPPTYILFFGLLESIRDVCGYSKDDPFMKFSLLGAYISATGIFFFAFKSPQVMTIAMINSAMEPYGRTFNEGTWMLVMFTATMVYMIIYAILMKTVYKVNLEPLKALDFNKIEAMRDTPDHFNRNQIAIIALIVGCIAYILFTTIYPTDAPAYAQLTCLGNSWIWVLGAALCALIRRPGTKENYIPIGKMLSQSSMWSMIALIGALVMLGQITSDAELGIRPWLVEVLSPVFGGTNIWILMAIVVVFSTLVTQIANGLVLTMAICPIVTPFVCQLAETTGINPDVILIISNLCSGYAFWTVAASTNAAFILSRPEITQKFVWTKGVQLTFVFMVVAYVMGMLYTYIL
jgi:sodium-dependent dicarboxylate transporter 2/3/5